MQPLLSAGCSPPHAHDGSERQLREPDIVFLNVADFGTVGVFGTVGSRPPQELSPPSPPCPLQSSLATLREELRSKEAERASAVGRLRGMGALVAALEAEHAALRNQVGEEAPC